MYDANTESPTSSGYHTSIVRAESPTLGDHHTRVVHMSIACTKIYVPHRVVFVRVLYVHKITRKAITSGATWQPVNKPKKTGLEREGSMID